ncbi:ABC-2 type transport system ATP-binding protein [Lipingzhangella halophila]|uniref:ABC-2 type transport system ATP-binding protein n=1 Tax=Lipingzhangella halophila TaxID=1783352 RepID=A0A7W7W3U4_9ACTN|nr:ABC transporter ATP-binding protein [Lipingzhangella halophila]MBB4933417.1 ABC-2 type transport system ATP-binding protein [Lipingzhangella halophila]
MASADLVGSPGEEERKHTVVRTSELTKRYGSETVVDRLGVTVRRGEIYGFLGLNGAGKSTTMKMLLDLARPTAGGVTVFGLGLAANRARILPRIGSLIESPSYYGHLTGEENLEIVRILKKLPQAEIDRVLGVVRLTENRRKPVRNYSLGMKQRLGLAMALMGSPELLILDEPTNGLDPSGIQEIRDLIVRLPSRFGMTVLVSSHLLSEVEQMADTVGIIDQGRLLYEGALRDFRDRGWLRIAVADSASAASVLRRAGWRVTTASEGELALPLHPDEQIARVVRILVGAGTQLYRVEVRRRTLEEVFLQITGEASDEKPVPA